MADNNQKKGYKKKQEEIDIRALDGQIPPQALELEESVLGAILMEAHCFSEVSNILKPETFYSPINGKVYSAIEKLGQQQMPVDAMTVMEQLKKDGCFDEVGGLQYLAKLTNNVISTINVYEHAKILSEKFLARQLIVYSGLIGKKAFAEDTDVDLLIQEAEAKLFDISQNNMRKDFSHIRSVAHTALETIQAAMNKEGIGGVPSGFRELDKKTNGWQNSDLIIIAARPAMGKTAFVLSMARNIADAGMGVAVFSLEMSNVQLVNRLLVNVTEIESEKIKKGQLSPEEFATINKGIALLENKEIYLDDTPSLSVFEFATKARRLKREHNVSIMIIDYLQLMNASGMSYGSREQEVSTISRSLKQLAKELNIPIIALSQLNRGVESRDKTDKRPQLSDLRESGAIEQDADMVLFIHRPEYYKMDTLSNGQPAAGKAEIIIAKHRNGATGDVILRFMGAQTKFTDDNSDGMGGNYVTSGSRMNEGYQQGNDVANMQPPMPNQGSAPIPQSPLGGGGNAPF